MSAGVAGAATTRPGMCANHASSDCECCAAEPRQMPIGMARHQRHAALAAEHEAILRRLVDDFVDRAQREIGPPAFPPPGAVPGQRHADRGAHDGRPREIGVSMMRCGAELSASGRGTGRRCRRGRRLRPARPRVASARIASASAWQAACDGHRSSAPLAGSPCPGCRCRPRRRSGRAPRARRRGAASISVARFAVGGGNRARPRTPSAAGAQRRSLSGSLSSALLDFACGRGRRRRPPKHAPSRGRCSACRNCGPPPARMRATSSRAAASTASTSLPSTSRRASRCRARAPPRLRPRSCGGRGWWRRIAVVLADEQHGQLEDLRPS